MRKQTKMERKITDITGGMDPTSGLHTGVKLLAFMKWGKPTNLWISCWVGAFLEHSLPCGFKLVKK